MKANTEEKSIEVSSKNFFHYKECSPENTIKKLKEILEKLNIATKESYVKKSSIDTFSLRVSIVGTDIGANGKGISLEYARASAYAEFMERLENGILISPSHLIPKNSFYISYDEQNLTAEQLINNNLAMLNYIFHVNDLENLLPHEQASFLIKHCTIDKILYGLNNSFLCIPFYNYKKNEIDYLPYHIYKLLYTSNGMSAGNSLEEAIVQGMSEILERMVQKKLFKEHSPLPDIPEEYIMNFPEIYERYKILQKNDNYNIKFKDCSFGGKYPVIALFIIEKNTGAYGIKLGCHPDIGIAMERALTECTQGCDFMEYSDRSILDISNNAVHDSENIFNAFKIGYAQYPYEIFESTSDLFTPMKSVKGLSNNDMAKELIQLFINEGYDVLIRDVSFLDFPAVHIIIPGISEVQEPTIKLFHAHNTKNYVYELITHPKSIHHEQLQFVEATLQYFRGHLMENSVKSLYRCWAIPDSAIPYEEEGCSNLYLSALCRFLRNDYLGAANEIKAILKNTNTEKKRYLLAKYHYFVYLSQNKTHSEAITFLKEFFTLDVINYIDKLYSDKENLLAKLYPDVDNYIFKCEKIDMIREKILHIQTQNKIIQHSIYLNKGAQ